MPLTIKNEKDSLAALLSGEIDHHSSQKMREEIDQCAREQHTKELILDFARVEFMDSSGIGLVLGRFRLMQELEGKLVLRNLPAQIKRVMRVAGIENLDIRQEGMTE